MLGKLIHIHASTMNLIPIYHTATYVSIQQTETESVSEERAVQNHQGLCENWQLMKESEPTLEETATVPLTRKDETMLVLSAWEGSRDSVAEVLHCSSFRGKGFLLPPEFSILLIKPESKTDLQCRLMLIA